MVLGSIPSYPRGFLKGTFLIYLFFEEMEFVVYILKGKRYYVGYTGNLQRRLEEHKRGQTKRTKELGAWELVKVIPCATKTEAIILERKIKRGGHVERWL